ncbi:hypothetical protein MYSE111917_19135 [Mycobacterium senriense]
MGVLCGIRRAGQVITSKLNVRVINRFLENLAIQLEKPGSKRFGLAHRLDN